MAPTLICHFYHNFSNANSNLLSEYEIRAQSPLSNAEDIWLLRLSANKNLTLINICAYFPLKKGQSTE